MALAGITTVTALKALKYAIIESLNFLLFSVSLWSFFLALSIHCVVNLNSVADCFFSLALNVNHHDRNIDVV